MDIEKEGVKMAELLADMDEAITRNDVKKIREVIAHMELKLHKKDPRSRAFRYSKGAVVKMGSCVVESGQIMVVDPGYLLPCARLAKSHPESGKAIDYDDFTNQLRARSQKTGNYDFAGIPHPEHNFDVGIVSHPGGDGEYPIYGIFGSDGLAAIVVATDPEELPQELQALLKRSRKPKKKVP